MTRDRWTELDRAFERALDLQGNDRRSFVEGLDDPELRSAVAALLSAAEESGPFLETPVHEICAPPWDEVFDHSEGRARLADDDRSGERIGPYRLVRCVGRGGMATVYLAERADGLWEQEVALKLIRRGLQSDDVVGRFLAERQILSSLRHPNIASLLDGGTTREGLPYLVMEYVAGTPITRYCDERALSIDARLRLFCDVGRAVQHAHRSLAVHRDLKPSNILVTDEGRVKLLDFGIAKLLDADPRPGSEGLTRPGHRPLTPEYASPEQLAGGPITTASDVYQLGVLLYRLLCGKSPHEGSGPWPAPSGLQHRRADGPVLPSRALSGSEVSDEEPGAATGRAVMRGTTVEALSRTLRGDLDTIVGKALRREPDERYDSAAALVEDVERYLEQLPVRARAPTRRYRLRKFLKRNRWVAPVTAGTLLVAAGYAFTMDRQARALARERNVARAQAERAEAIQSFMTGLFQTADPLEPGDPQRGRQITVAEALDVGAERARTDLADQPALQADVFGAIAEVYASLDLMEPAVRLRRDALELARRVHGPGAPEVAAHLHALGNAVASPDSARRLLQRALTLTGERHGTDDPIYGDVLVSLGYLELERGQYEEAAGHLERGISIFEEAEPVPERSLAAALGALTQVYPRLSRPEEAAEAGRWALEYFRRALGDEHPRTAMARVHLAAAHDGLGQPERAIELYRSALPIMDRSLGDEHTETINSRNNLAISLLQTGELEQAEQVFRRTLDIRIEKFGESHPDVADGLQNLAATLNRLGRTDEAEAMLQRARSIYVEVLGPDDYRVALPLLTLAQIRLDRSDFVGAEAPASEAARTLRRTLPSGHFATAVAECRWGLALAGLGRTAQATALVERASSSLLATRQGGANRLGCLEGAVEHLRSIGAEEGRWAPFAEALQEVRDEGDAGTEGQPPGS